TSSLRVHVPRFGRRGPQGRHSNEKAIARMALLNQAGLEPGASRGEFLTRAEIPVVIEDALANTPVIDIHTHLFAPAFGKIGLWGIDELLTYHYLEAEFFRFSKVTPEKYWTLS